MRERTDNTGMDIRGFAEKVCMAVSTRIGADYQVKLQEVTKNNGVVLQGLVILGENRNISPTIYLNSFLNAYESGVPLAQIVERILKIYREDSPRKNVDMSFFRDFEKVRNRVCYRLVNREKNRMLLERIPHIEFLDLCICFYYAYQDSLLGTGSILIHNQHMEMWNSSTAELLKLAQKNTPRIFPWEIYSMEDMLRELVGGELTAVFCREEGCFDGDVSMQILSNRQRVHGAACMLYPSLLSRLAEKARSNFYILPSSVHETILLTEKGWEDVESLRDMVRDVNASQVEPEEVLADNLYYFDRLEGRVSVV